jgi:uncharacterized protein YdeI (YjbR/CyaY-like superfamily)
MPNKDPRIDDYIARSAEFARPILMHIRKLVHQACPEIEEGLKWNCPHFLRNGIVCGMAAFKAHCTLNFWKGKLIFGKLGEKDSMGQFGRLTAIANLPEDEVLLGYIKEAVRLNEKGIKPPAKAKTSRPKILEIPPYFSSALKGNKKALAAFEAFSYSHRKEYVEWITEAKTEETRTRRLETAIKWLSEGKPRYWKYNNC